MEIKHAKGVTVVPFEGKSSQSTEFPEIHGKAVDSFFTDAMKEEFDFIGKDGEETPDTQSDSAIGKFLAAVTGSDPKVKEKTGVPSAIEVYEKHPDGRMFADGTISQAYENLELDRNKSLNTVDEKLAQGGLAPQETKYLQEYRTLLLEDLAQIKEEKEVVLDISRQVQEKWKKELELVPKVNLGLIDIEAADLNGDKYFGPPPGLTKGGRPALAIGIKDNNGIDELRVVDEDGKPIKFDTVTGDVLSAGVIASSYVWDMNEQVTGMQFDANATKPAGVDMVFQAQNTMADQIKPYPGAPQTLSSDLYFPAPEAVWVKTLANGDYKLDVDGNYADPHLAFTNGQQIAAPADKENYAQVKVAKVEVETVTVKNTNDHDYQVTLRDMDNHIIARIQITGNQNGESATMKQLAITGGYEHFGYANGPNSSYDVNNRRQSPLEVSVVHTWDPDGYNTMTKFESGNNPISNNTIDWVNAATTKRLNKTSGEGNKYDAQLGLIVATGTATLFNGSTGNDLFYVGPPPDMGRVDDPDFFSVANMHGGYNAVVGTGSVSALGVTVANIQNDKHPDAIVYLKQPGVVLWNHWEKEKDADGNKTGKDVALNYAKNPKSDYTIRGGAEVTIDNTLEESGLGYDNWAAAADNNGKGPNGMAKDGPTKTGLSPDGASTKANEEVYKDDVYDVTTTKIFMSNAKVKDKPKNYNVLNFDIQTADENFADLTSNLQKAIREETDDDLEAAELEGKGYEIAGATLANQAQADLDGFFGSYMDTYAEEPATKNFDAVVAEGKTS